MILIHQWKWLYDLLTSSVNVENFTNWLWNVKSTLYTLNKANLVIMYYLFIHWSVQFVTILQLFSLGLWEKLSCNFFLVIFLSSFCTKIMPISWNEIEKHPLYLCSERISAISFLKVWVHVELIWPGNYLRGKNFHLEFHFFNEHKLVHVFFFPMFPLSIL